MVNILKLAFVLSMLGWIFSSCEKEYKTINNPNNYNNYGDVLLPSEVFAGIYDSTFNYSLLQPSLEVAITWDSQILYGFGSDSLDINSDGNYDLFITLSLLNEDSLHLLTGLPNPFPYCRLNLRNGLEVAFYTETFYVGLGQTSTSKYVDRLDYNERIDQITNWQAENSVGIIMWGENPGGGGTPPFGDWYYASSTFYIATKMNGKYGWIEVDATNPKNPKFVSYAIQL